MRSMPRCARAARYSWSSRIAFFSISTTRTRAAWHLLAWVELKGARVLAGYLRLLAPGCKFTEASIGRVLTTRDFRRTRAWGAR